MFQGFRNEKKLEKKRKGETITPLPTLPPLPLTYLRENALRYPSGSRVTKKTQVHHIYGIAHCLGTHLDCISLHIITQRIAISKGERIERQN